MVKDMIEIKEKFYTQRLFARELSRYDLFWPVCYYSYRGDPGKIPWYYKIVRGSSAVSDLTMDMEQQLALMKSNTRNEIKRAIKEGCSFEIGQDYQSFIPYYNAFSKSKGLNDYVNMKRLTKYKGDNIVFVTKALHGETVLSMHATVVNLREKIAYLILSCSHRLDANADKKLIGWGNRYLHYKDLEAFKAMGVEVYDWSGVCTAPDDPRYSIGVFKLSFGGKIVSSLVLSSPLFLLLEWLRSIVLRMKLKK